jgi:hypothetical protein
MEAVQKILRTCLVVLLMVGLSFRAAAQFPPEELARDGYWEDFLATAEITARKQFRAPEAVTRPWKLTLERDGISRNALWKNAHGKMHGYVEGWQYEVAAYRLDRYLGVNMVPPTVQRVFRRESGSCQLWINARMDLIKKDIDDIRVPPDKLRQWNLSTYLQRAFDNLIANVDRHQGNVLIGHDWELVLIDHSRSFRTSHKHVSELIYTEHHPHGPRVMKKLPRRFVTRLEALDAETLESIVGPLLTERELEAVLARRVLILDEIEKLSAQQGVENVLYGPAEP